MANKLDETQKFTFTTDPAAGTSAEESRRGSAAPSSPKGADGSAQQVIRSVYQALKAKGHDPIMQLVGYLLSGDPTYITSYQSARSLIRRLERDEILEELVRAYVERIEDGKGR